MPPADPAAATAAARAATAAAMARVKELSDLAAAAGPVASDALAGWLRATVGAVQEGRRATAEERIGALADVQAARALLHRLGDELVSVAMALDQAASAHVAAVQAAPVAGRA